MVSYNVLMTNRSGDVMRFTSKLERSEKSQTQNKQEIPGKLLSCQNVTDRFSQLLLLLLVLCLHPHCNNIFVPEHIVLKDTLMVIIKNSTFLYTLK